jgi:hypothetical protein
MQERQVELPYLPPLGSAWGLGWEIFDCAGGPLIGHDGDTVGQSAFLRVVPTQDVAIALLTNGGNARGLFEKVVRRILRDLVGIELPPAPTPPADTEMDDAARYLGRYSSQVADTSVTQDEAGRV